MDHQERLRPVVFGATRAQDFRLLYSPTLGVEEEGRLLTLCRGAIEGLTDESGARTLKDQTWVAATLGGHALFGMGASGEYLAGEPVQDRHGRNLAYFVGWLVKWRHGVSLPMEPSWYACLYRYVETIQDEYLSAPKQMHDDIWLAWNNRRVMLLSRSGASLAAPTRIPDLPVSLVQTLSGNLFGPAQGECLWYFMRQLQKRLTGADIALCINVQSASTAERLLREADFDMVSCKGSDLGRPPPGPTKDGRPVSERAQKAGTESSRGRSGGEARGTLVQPRIRPKTKASPFGALKLIVASINRMINRIPTRRAPPKQSKNEFLQRQDRLRRRSKEAIQQYENRIPASKKVQDSR